MADPAPLALPAIMQPRQLGEFVVGFACVFGGLALPSPGLGPLFTRITTAVGDRFVSFFDFGQGVSLRFWHDLPSHPWQTTLGVRTSTLGQPILLPIELRTLAFLPIVTFVALVVAAPLGARCRNLKILAAGLGLLVPLVFFLIALPVVSFLGGWGPIRLFELGAAAQAIVNVVYRTLVVPPGMAYALPLVLFWALVATVGKAATPAERG